MESWLGGWLSHASLGLIFVGLVGAGLGVPLPEDLALLAAGALAHRTPLPLALVVAVCAAGVLLGDVVLFLGARRLGQAAFERPLFRRLLPPARRARLEVLFAKRGAALVFFARHLAGIRAPVFALAGIQGMPLARFVTFDVLGLCISAPVMVGLGYVFSSHLDELRAGVVRMEHAVVGAAVLGLCGYVLVVATRRLRAGRRPPPAAPPTAGSS